jgi:hypothetical protein
MNKSKKKCYLLYAALFIYLILSLSSCKTAFNKTSGSFSILNQSSLAIEFIWIAPKGEFYPTAKSIYIPRGEVYELQGLSAGTYDIAIDFEDALNSINSKKDPSLNLVVKTGLTTFWRVNPNGTITIQ